MVNLTNENTPPIYCNKLVCYGCSPKCLKAYSCRLATRIWVFFKITKPQLLAFQSLFATWYCLKSTLLKLEQHSSMHSMDMNPITQKFQVTNQNSSKAKNYDFARHKNQLKFVDCRHFPNHIAPNAQQTSKQHSLQHDSNITKTKLPTPANLQHAAKVKHFKIMVHI